MDKVLFMTKGNDNSQDYIQGGIPEFLLYSTLDSLDAYSVKCGICI